MDHDALVALIDRASTQGAPPDVVSRAQEEVSELILASQDRLYGLCLRFVGEPERALDLARAAIRVGVRRLGEWRGEGSFWTWWYGICRDVCLRSLARKRTLLTTDGVLIPGSEAASTLAQLRREDWQELLRHVGMSDLSADEQEAVYLRYVEGLEVTEITEVMQLQGTGARGLLQRSRHKLGLALRDAPAVPSDGLYDHPSWSQLARVEVTEPTKQHLAECPRCRVDRRRLRHPMGVRARDLQAVEAELESARAEAIRTLQSSWRSAMSGGPPRDDAVRVPLLARHTRVSDVRVDGLVEQTGMAVAYRGHHADTGQPCLVQVLAAKRAVQPKIQRDFRQLRSLRHPHLVGLLDLVEHDGNPVLVTELTDGPSLQELLRHEVTLPLEMVDTLAVHILTGMASAHAHGIVHRDLRTANVLVDVSGPQVVGRVTGLAMARLLALMERGTNFGTPPYMSPEQLQDPNRADARSDVFALGTVLYELATGQRCFAAADHVDAVRRVTDLDYVPPTSVRPQLPERMAHAIAACLKHDPDSRPKSAAALLDLWTRGAGGVVRTGHSLTEGEAASYRYLRQIRPLPDPMTETEGSGSSIDFNTPPAVPDISVSPRGGSLVAFVGVVAILGIAAAGALWSTVQPNPVSGPIPWRMARAVHDAVDPDLSADGRAMLFSDQRHVYTFGAGETQPTMLTKGFPDPATDPAWSADGRKVAFSAGGALWVMRVNSRRALFVTRPAYEPSWSPDGTRIAYVTAPSPTDGTPRRAALKTVLIDQRDEDVRYVTVAPESDAGAMQPAYDPTGNRMAWASPDGLRVAASDGGTGVPLPGYGWDPHWLDADTLAVLCEPAPNQFALCTFAEGSEGWRGPTVWVELTERPRTFDVSLRAGRVIIGLNKPVDATVYVEPYTWKWSQQRDGTTDLRGAAPAPTDGRVAAIDTERPGRIVMREPAAGWTTLVELDDVEHVTWRPDGSRLTVSGTLDGQIGVFDLDPASGRSTPLTGPTQEWTAPVFWSPFGARGAWTDRGISPSTPVVLDARSDWTAELDTARASAPPFSSAGAFSPDGLRLLVQDANGDWYVYDLTTESARPVLVDATAMSWWSDSRVLVAQGSTIRLYDLESTAFAALEVDLSPWTVLDPTGLRVDGGRGIWVSVHKEAGGLQRIDLPLDLAAM